MDTAPERPIRLLSIADIAKMFGVADSTVRGWRMKRFPNTSGFPVEDYAIGKDPGWLPEREQEIRDWYANRPRGQVGRPAGSRLGGNVLEAKRKN